MERPFVETRVPSFALASRISRKRSERLRSVPKPVKAGQSQQPEPLMWILRLYLSPTFWRLGTSYVRTRKSGILSSSRGTKPSVGH